MCVRRQLDRPSLAKQLPSPSAPYLFSSIGIAFEENIALKCQLISLITRLSFVSSHHNVPGMRRHEGVSPPPPLPVSAFRAWTTRESATRVSSTTVQVGRAVLAISPHRRGTKSRHRECKHSPPLVALPPPTSRHQPSSLVDLRRRALPAPRRLNSAILIASTPTPATDALDASPLCVFAKTG